MAFPCFRTVLLLPFLAFAEGNEFPCLFLQPYGNVRAEVLRMLTDSLQNFCRTGSAPVTLPARSIPSQAMERHFNRKRASAFLDETESLRTKLPQDFRNSLILAITEADLTTERNPYQGWGTLGMGRIHARLAVISPFLLFSDTLDTLWRSRLTRIARHELGHALGLIHCTNKHCLMHEYHGSIQGIDSTSGFCPGCAARIARSSRR